MELEYKNDFLNAISNWKKFWKGQLHRPILRLVAPKSEGQFTPYPNPYLFIDKKEEELLNAVEDYLDNTLFIGDAIPSYCISFAPDTFSSYLGADIKWNENSRETAWVEPFVKSWDDVEIKFNPDSFWWQKISGLLQAFRNRFDKRAILIPPHIQGGLDCLSAIRGVNELLMDIIDCPEKVDRALEQVSAAVQQVRDAYKEILDSDIGYMNRHMMYSSQMIDVPQCDFSCMISPEMFNKFQIPILQKELEGLGPVDYHLDGPDAIKHLESICTLDNIKVIQWQPGAGEAAEQDWWHLYKKIDQLEKGIYFYGPRAVYNSKKAWRELGARLIYADILCSKEYDAYRIVEEFENL